MKRHSSTCLVELAGEEALLKINSNILFFCMVLRGQVITLTVGHRELEQITWIGLQLVSAIPNAGLFDVTPSSFWDGLSSLDGARGGGRQKDYLVPRANGLTHRAPPPGMPENKKGRLPVKNLKWGCSSQCWAHPSCTSSTSRPSSGCPGGRPGSCPMETSPLHFSSVTEKSSCCYAGDRRVGKSFRGPAFLCPSSGA
jgi:hypothetical protein